MNIWKESYPENFNDLIKSCEQSLVEMEGLLNSKDCKRLNQLYQFNRNKEISRNKELFERLGYKPNSKLNNKSKEDDEISGVYVFGECLDKEDKVKPRYVGISRTIFRRLKQHGWGKLHNEATFATLKFIHKSDYKGLRTAIPVEEIEKQQEIIQNYKVAILPEKDFYTMYFKEVYFAGKWKTKWNSFRTH